jgi:hypothetical protein
MRSLFVALLAGGFIAAVAGAAVADPFEGLYGNSATSTSPAGKTITYFFNKDGTFAIKFPSGKTASGTYVWKDAATACFTITDPPPKPGENTTNCRPFPETHHVGDVWQEKDSDGVSWTNRVIAGR